MKQADSARRWEALEWPLWWAALTALGSNFGTQAKARQSPGSRKGVGRISTIERGSAPPRSNIAIWSFTSWLFHGSREGTSRYSAFGLSHASARCPSAPCFWPPCRKTTAGAVFLTGHDPDFHAQVYARRGKKAEARQQLEVALKTPVFADAAGPASSSTPCGR